MTVPSTTRMSSKGQVVIPQEIRMRMGLRPGTQFVVVGEGDVVVLKGVSAPSMKDFDALIGEARRRAKVSGLGRSDVKATVAKARRPR